MQALGAKRQGTAVSLVLGLLLLGYLFPVLWLTATSVKPKLDVIARPPVWLFKPSLESYASVFLAKDSPFMGCLLNSTVATLGSLAIALAVSVLAAYGLARYRFPGREFTAFAFLSMRMLPPAALMVPLFLLTRRAGLVDTIPGLIIPYAGLNVPLCVWMLRAFIQEIPAELDEAAMVDGCSRLGAFTRVVVPLLGPGLVATAIFAFTLAWNDLAIAVTLTTSHATTLPVLAARFKVDEGILWGEMAAVTMAIIVPVVAFCLLIQKHLVRGLTMGSIK